VVLKLLALPNVPVPLVLHVLVVAPEAVTVPLSVTLGLFLHTVMSSPASTIGAGLIVITTTSLTALHPTTVDVNVSVTVPAAMSPAPGVYVRG
jgi:hypothetical protein